MDFFNRKHFELCFLILHFLDFEMTSKCIESIFDTFFNNSIYIVIVDNGSTNESGKLLEEKYVDNNFVYVIRNKSNLGFANGNNTGYKWIKDNIDCDFIGVINNDIIINQSNCFELIKEEFSNSNFAILGPDIVSSCGKHQSPIFKKALSLEEILEYKQYLETIQKRFFFHYVKEKIFSIFVSKDRKKDEIGELNSQEYFINPVLHGACYFLSHIFIDKNDYIFNPKTFMYFEENILHYECQKKGLIMVYFPKIKVNHLEDISTKAFIKKSYKREKWILDESLKSVCILLDIMRDDKYLG